MKKSARPSASIAAALAVMLTALTAGCAAQPQSPRTASVISAESSLTVRYDPTRYGDAWVKLAAQAFEEQNPSVHVTLTSDANIAATMAQTFSTDSSVPDVLLMPSTNWQAYARKGWLTDLSPLLGVNVDGQTLSQRILPGLRDFGSFGGGTYVLPLADGVSGLLYNASMFAQYGWAVPKTAKEMLELLPQIKAKGIAPFTWAGSDQSAWSSTVCSWWEQLSGQKGIAAFLAMAGPSVYRDGSRLRALELFQTLVTNDTNCIAAPQNLTAEASLEQLFNGKAAMMPGSSWMVPRYRSLLRQGTVVKLMRCPAPDGAVLPTAYDATAGDFACIPSRAQAPSLARQFLLCLAKDSVSAGFFELTSTPSAFNGMPAETRLEADAASSAAASAAVSAAAAVSEAIASANAAAASGTSSGTAPIASYAASQSSDIASSALSAASSAVEAAGSWDDPFEQSVFELCSTSVPLRFYSKSPVYYNSLFNWPGSGEPFNDIYFGLRTARQIFDDDAAYAAQNWNAAGRVDSALAPFSAASPPSATSADSGGGPSRPASAQPAGSSSGFAQRADQK